MPSTAYTAFGDRVVLLPVEEKFETSIVLPQTRNQQHMLGRAIAVGPKASEFIREGDVYLFQVAMDPRTGNAMVPVHGAGDNQVLVQHWRDLIATVTKDVIKLETFHVVGHWILLEAVKLDTGMIVLPDNRPTDPTETNFKVAQLGSPFEGLAPGDVVVVEKGRCNPFELKLPNGDPKQYFYIDKQFVYGVFHPASEAELTTTA